MRVLSYNIHGCIGRRDRFDAVPILQNILSVDADFVGLQEVYDRKARDRSFLLKLREIGYETVHYGATIRQEDDDYGNVILVKGVPDRIDEIDLTLRSSFEPRGAIRVVVRIEDRPWEIVTTHLGLGFIERKRQIERLVDALSDREPTADFPRILLGDLNEWIPWSGRERLLDREFGPSPRLRTFPATCPIFALDRILVTPESVPVQRHVPDGVEFRRASDHLPLVAELG